MYRISSTFWFVLISVLFMATFGFAMPPHPDLADAVQQRAIDTPHYLQNLEELRARGVNSPNFVQWRTGGELDETTFNSIVLLVDFNDHQATTSASFFDDLMYGAGNGTVADFYDETSYGEFELTSQDFPSTVGWLRMPENYSYYVDGQNGFGGYPENAQGLAEAAVLAANPYVDFSQYDHDGDGYIDGLFIMHAGTGAELSGDNDDIWSHKWQIPGGVNVDGVTASVYAMQPEFWYSPGDMTIGVVAHEMGHAVFGLPDLYDYDYDSRGLGNWSLMSGGSWNGNLGASPAHPDAWCRTAMGFVDPINVTSDRIGEQIENVETAPVIYRLWTEGQGGSQYFLVENRWRTGYDSALPSQGLLIYHVDETEYGNDNQWYPGHTNSGNYQVALEQADGLWELEQNGSADSGDPWPGSNLNYNFNDVSTPDSRSYNFQTTDVAVENISFAAQTMTADLIVGVAGGGPDYSIALTPETNPMVVPAGGGFITYDAQIGNTLAAPEQHNIWIEADLPNGNTYHMNTFTVTFQPGNTINANNVSHWVPAGAPAGSYTLRVNVGDFPGVVFVSDSFPFSKQGTVTNVDGNPDSWSTDGWADQLRQSANDAPPAIPSEFAVNSIYPNPFNAQTTIEVALPQTSELTVTVHNTLGQHVATLAQGQFAAGQHSFTLDATGFSSGLYFLRASDGATTATSKLMLMK